MSDIERFFAKFYLMKLAKGNLASMVIRYAGMRLVEKWAKRGREIFSVMQDAE